MKHSLLFRLLRDGSGSCIPTALIQRLLFPTSLMIFGYFSNYVI